jgi:SAM-dependent methyltransferase
MLKQIAKKILPKNNSPFFEEIFLQFRGIIYRLILNGSKYTCPFCKYSFNRFLPDGLNHAVLREKKIIGGGYRENATCPFCLSTDRERLVYLFLKSSNLLRSDIKLLSYCSRKEPSKDFEKTRIKYFSADLNCTRAKIKMDIQEIKFPSNYFDAIICNHVLEHILNDKLAMKDLYRVLKPKGWAILQVPCSQIIQPSIEDPSVTTSKDRARVFGQSDHVRIYSKIDYLNRLKSVGFLIKQEKTK